MPDKYIVNMTEKTTPEDTNLLVIEDSQDTKRMTWSNLVKPIKDMIDNQEIESGSNSNGAYIRFSDGTQICWHTVSFPATFTPWGNIYAFIYATRINYPAAFIAEPSVNVTNSTKDYTAMITRVFTYGTGIGTVSLARPTIADETYSIDYVATGRWK